MSLNKTKLAKAIALVVTSSTMFGSISDANATATTMYNLTTANADDFSSNTTACAPCNGGAGTDGWVWGFDGEFGFAPQGSTNSVAKWAGTTGTNTTPFGYNGGAPVHWALSMTSYESAEISSQDSLSRYSVAADIDTAKGAWSDNSTGPTPAQGWRHDLDFGLFRSDVGGTVTLSAQTILQAGFNFGFTIFKGMDTSAVGYNHHGGWNDNNNLQTGAPNAASLPEGNSEFNASDIVAYSIGGSSPININTISFNADPGQIYTILIGGYRNGSSTVTTDGYKLTVNSVSNVPIPGALWLFGSTVAGLIGLRRQHKAYK